ncbi:pyrroloquinoline quinone biosynthesis protein PqqE [Kitasatospora sp. NPDC059673]|uniref:pyrroloquinoline quinone biosynthesis protein PqqE n=1 Tax=Kitasatospora sp. NPDC059673 TaxID=3346901 RepID=UPI0036CE0ABB
MTTRADGPWRLRRGVRLGHDQVRSVPVLLHPEGVLLLGETAAAVLARCDGATGTAAILADLEREYSGVRPDEVRSFLASLAEQYLLEETGPARPPLPAALPKTAVLPETPATPPLAEPPALPDGDRTGRPFGLLAELTYRCPLRCGYCSNPVALDSYADELSPAEWRRVLTEARALGVLQVHLSGGEPLLRRDLPALVAHAQGLGLYTSLITGGQVLSPARLTELAAAGLDHVQLSIQDATAAPADALAGRPVHARKLAAAGLVKAAGLPLTVNVVLHRRNIEHVPALIDLAAELHADRLELANTQYYGWALRNRAALLPTGAQLAAAEAAVTAARERLAGTLQIVYVVSDYHESWPKPCMNGWASRQLTVAPNGDVLPCPAAAQIPGLGVVGVRDRPLADIWFDSPAFTRFRGTDWMPEPCRSCERKELDHGGCRCQAFQLTGDPAATDPVCRLSPHHALVTELVRAGEPVRGTEPVRGGEPDPTEPLVPRGA